MLKVGVDPRIKNNNEFEASNYMEDIEQLKAMQSAHSPGIWAAYEAGDAERIEQLLKGW